MSETYRLAGGLPATLRPSGARGWRAGPWRAWTWGPLAALGRTLLIWQQRAAERRHLGSLSDHHLRDVGLSRAQVEHELAKAFWRP